MAVSATITSKQPTLLPRRFSQVYVDVPPSPYRRNLSFSNKPLLHSHAGTPDPDCGVHMDLPKNAPSVTKRRRSSTEFSASSFAPMSKKQKSQGETQDRTAKARHQETAITSALKSDERLLYCHQCSRGYSQEGCIRCTFVGNKRKRCSLRFCRACLRNRYDIDMDALVTRRTEPESVGDHHIVSGYVFKCPRCSESCNCRQCRKAQGLQPTGKMLMHETSKESVRDGKAKSSAPSRSVPQQSRPIKSMRSGSKIKPTTNDALDTKGKDKSKPNLHIPMAPKSAHLHKPGCAPRVHWDRIPVPSSFTLEHALQRIHIHDFALRFASLLDLPRAHLDELADVGGRRGTADHDIDEGEDAGVVIGWVTEACVRALFSGLLSLVGDRDEFKALKRTHSALTDCIKAIKAKYTEVNLTRLWATLADSCPFLHLPDPLPPPSSSKRRFTRSGAQVGARGVHIASAAQLVPVVTALIEIALDSPRVKEELEEGLRRAKDLTKDERERARAEKERWDTWRQVKGNIATQSEREKHKRVLACYESALNIALQANSLRFTPIGADLSGRVFVAASSSAAEREAAALFLAGNDQRSGTARARSSTNAHERESLRRWDWFVAVHGKRPSDASSSRTTGLEGEGAEEDARWWGFWDPAEIRRLADWVAHINDLDIGSGAAPLAIDRSATGSSLSTQRKSVAGLRSAALAVDSFGPMSPLSSNSESETPLSSAERDVLSPLTSGYEAEYRAMQEKQQISGKDIQQLVRSLREYADVLEWRISRTEPDRGEVESQRAARNAGRKDGSIRPEAFYR